MGIDRRFVIEYVRQLVVLRFLFNLIELFVWEINLNLFNSQDQWTYDNFSFLLRCGEICRMFAKHRVGQY